MNFVVDDLLDFAQLNNDKFRKDISRFDLREAIQEVFSIQEEKAIMQDIKLNIRYRPQTIGEGASVYSFFNEAKRAGEGESSYQEQATGELCNFKVKLTEEQKEMPIMVETDKRRIQQCLINL